jgi:hypothetical protein
VIVQVFGKFRRMIVVSESSFVFTVPGGEVLPVWPTVIYVYCYMRKVRILCISIFKIHLPETGVSEICTLPES